MSLHSMSSEFDTSEFDLVDEIDIMSEEDSSSERTPDSPAGSATSSASPTLNITELQNMLSTIVKTAIGEGTKLYVEKMEAKQVAKIESPYAGLDANAIREQIKENSLALLPVIRPELFENVKSSEGSVQIPDVSVVVLHVLAPSPGVPTIIAIVLNDRDANGGHQKVKLAWSHRQHTVLAALQNLLELTMDLMNIKPHSSQFDDFAATLVNLGAGGYYTQSPPTTPRANPSENYKLWWGLRFRECLLGGVQIQDQVVHHGKNDRLDTEAARKVYGVAKPSRVIMQAAPRKRGRNSLHPVPNIAIPKIAINDQLDADVYMRSPHVGQTATPFQLQTPGASPVEGSIPIQYSAGTYMSPHEFESDGDFKSHVNSTPGFNGNFANADKVDYHDGPGFSDNYVHNHGLDYKSMPGNNGNTMAGNGGMNGNGIVNNGMHANNGGMNGSDFYEAAGDPNGNLPESQRMCFAINIGGGRLRFVNPDNYHFNSDGVPIPSPFLNNGQGFDMDRSHTPGYPPTFQTEAHNHPVQDINGSFQPGQNNEVMPEIQGALHGYGRDAFRLN